MVDKHQKNQYQLKLAFMEETKSEAPKSSQQGNESAIAKHKPESSTTTEQLMEEILKRENLIQALKRVKENKGSPGIDQMKVEQLPGYLKENWLEIRKLLLEGKYKPKPVKRVEIDKPDGGKRKLGIPTVMDRFIQQALLQVLQKQWDTTFSQNSYGFRPRRSAHQAIEQAQKYIKEGYEIVVDIDLEKFFDRVNHDLLMSKIAKRVEDKRVLKLIRGFLNAGVMENGLVSTTEEGTPQGGPLSPLLSNLMLDELDKELEKRGHKFCRFADDCNIYVKSEKAGQRVMQSISKFITQKLKLKVNSAKSAVGKPKDRKFLGYSFSSKASGVKKRIAPKALEKFKRKVRELTKRTTRISLKSMLYRLTLYIRGWKAYFHLCQTPSVLKDLDSWIRRRIRSFLWTSWKTIPNRHKQLVKLGVNNKLALTTARSHKGSWPLSQSKAVLVALPNAYFKSIGLPLLAS
jgi:RNA-directed DNA polymerase